MNEKSFANIVLIVLKRIYLVITPILLILFLYLLAYALPRTSEWDAIALMPLIIFTWYLSAGIGLAGILLLYRSYKAGEKTWILLAMTLLNIFTLIYFSFLYQPTPYQAPINTPVNWLTYFNSQNPPSAPLGVVLPQSCRVVGSGRKMVDLVYKTFAGFEWLVDCGSKVNTQTADEILGPVLSSQDWIQCDYGLATAHWWKNGVMTSVAKSEDASVLFRVTQTLNENGECSL